jgi:hypothetical protein
MSPGHMVVGVQCKTYKMANIIVVSIDGEDFDYNSDVMLSLMKQLIKNRKIKVFDGDIIENDMYPLYGYRNNGKFVWWNDDIHELSDYPDDYGTLPDFVQISDDRFNPYYWVEAVDHNSYVWFSQEILDRLKFECIAGNEYQAKTSIRGKEYTFLVHADHFDENDVKRGCYSFSTCDRSGLIYMDDYD